MSAPDRFVDAGHQRLVRSVGYGFRCELLLDRGVRCHGDNTKLVLGSRDARATDIALEQLRDVQELQVADELSCTRHVDDRVFGITAQQPHNGTMEKSGATRTMWSSGVWRCVEPSSVHSRRVEFVRAGTRAVPHRAL